jgi:hypothetical protein
LLFQAVLSDKAHWSLRDVGPVLFADRRHLFQQKFDYCEEVTSLQVTSFN